MCVSIEAHSAEPFFLKKCPIIFFRVVLWPPCDVPISMYLLRKDGSKYEINSYDGKIKCAIKKDGGHECARVILSNAIVRKNR